MEGGLETQSLKPVEEIEKFSLEQRIGHVIECKEKGLKTVGTAGWVGISIESLIEAIKTGTAKNLLNNNGAVTLAVHPDFHKNISAINAEKDERDSEYQEIGLTTNDLISESASDAESSSYDFALLHLLNLPAELDLIVAARRLFVENANLMDFISLCNKKGYRLEIDQVYDAVKKAKTRKGILLSIDPRVLQFSFLKPGEAHNQQVLVNYPGLPIDLINGIEALGEYENGIIEGLKDAFRLLREK